MPTLTFAKGVEGTIRRAAILPIRYGLGPDRIAYRLEEMIAMLQRWDTTPTIPVTGIILERHREMVGALRGVDVAIHGYRHVAYSDLSTEEQALDLDAARRTFLSNGLNAEGFRSPYLQANETTIKLLRSKQLLFDSSASVFQLQGNHPLFLRAKALAESRYGDSAHAQVASQSDRTPFEMPVALPDDEILIDGLGIRNPSTLWRVYESMLQYAQSRTSLLVLQIHPERFRMCQDALSMLLSQATDTGAWKASLSEVAKWLLRGKVAPGSWPHGCSFAVAVTGDLDAFSLMDFGWRLRGG